MSMVYELREGAFLREGLTAPLAGAELERIRVDNDGVLSPEAVIEAARSDNTVLHHEFTWDDSRAAVKCRRQEALSLIGKIHVRIKGKKADPVRAFVKLKNTSTESFQPVAAVLSVPDAREKLLARGAAEIEGWQRRYGALKEFASILDAITDWKANP